MTTDTQRFFLIPRKTNCYATFDVMVGDKAVGCIQQKDPTMGLTAVKSPRDLWLIWIGDPSKETPDGPGAHGVRTRDDAIRYILQANDH